VTGRSRLAWAGGLLFALLSGGAYVLALRQPPPPAPAPVAARPAPRATPPPARPSRRTLPSSRTLILDEPKDERPSEPFGRAVVSGEVVTTAGDAVAGAKIVATSNGTRRNFRADADGTFNADLPAGKVVIWAERKDGALWTKSERVSFDASEGGEWEAELSLPSEEKAGLGIRIRAHEDGLMVRSVVPGSPAETVGLVPGDVIVEAGGESLAGKSTAHAVSVLTGPVGTSQEMVVQHDDGSRDSVTFVREPIKDARAPRR
jgi:hypothetical protein